MQRMITPTARRQLAWIAETYSIQKQVDVWCAEIARMVAQNRKPITEVQLTDVLTELEDLASTHSNDWMLTVKRFREAGWLDRLRALRTLLTRRQPLNRERVATHRFLALGDAVWVEVATVYEIDLVKKTVTFYAFWSYTPDLQDATTGHQPSEWQSS